MSTEVSEIIVQAFREGNFTAVGETTTVEEMQESIPRLNNYIHTLFGVELGEAFRSWYVPQEYDPEAPVRFPLTPTGTGATSHEPWQYPPSNVRLFVKVSAPRTLYFPATPSDGARMAYLDMGCTADVTLDGNGRTIEGELSLVSTAAVPPTDSTLHGREWFYRADLGDWILLKKPLVSSDLVPLPEEFDDLLVTGLAMRLAPRFGTQLDEYIIARNADMLGRLKLRYKQSERQPTPMELRLHMREF